MVDSHPAELANIAEQVALFVAQNKVLGGRLNIRDLIIPFPEPFSSRINQLITELTTANQDQQLLGDILYPKSTMSCFHLFDKRTHTATYLDGISPQDPHIISIRSLKNPDNTTHFRYNFPIAQGKYASVTRLTNSPLLSNRTLSLAVKHYYQPNPSLADNNAYFFNKTHSVNSAISLNEEHGCSTTAVLMPYINGANLTDILTDQVDNPLLAFCTIRQATIALGNLHKEAGVVHSDITHANILYSDQGVKLIDFDFSRNIGDLNDQARDYYASHWAPEVDPTTYASEQQDIYSFGYLLRSLYGNTFLRATTNEIETFINDALSPNPDERPPLLDLVNAIDRAIAHIMSSALQDNNTAAVFLILHEELDLKQGLLLNGSCINHMNPELVQQLISLLDEKLLFSCFQEHKVIALKRNHQYMSLQSDRSPVSINHCQLFSPPPSSRYSPINLPPKVANNLLSPSPICEPT